MRIEDLKDSRDRAACERAQHGMTIHDLRKADKHRARIQAPSKPTPNFDANTDREFNASVPFAASPGFEMNGNAGIPDELWQAAQNQKN